MWMISSKTQAHVVLLSSKHIKMGLSGPAIRTWFDWQKNILAQNASCLKDRNVPLAVYQIIITAD